MSESYDRSNWAQLFRIACAHIRQANSKQLIIDHWTFGGGSALMLQIGHRESHDVDIFLPDPQLLSFLDPEKQDFQFDIEPAAYEGDGARSLKLVFDQIGEIDFIVASYTEIEGEGVLLETVPEIITKKVYHRGASIRARDIFDIAAAGETHEEAIVAELSNYRAEVTQALVAINRLNADFVNGAIAQLAVKEEYVGTSRTALGRAKTILVRASRADNQAS